MTQVQAATLVAPRRIEVLDYPMPTELEPGAVLLRMTACPLVDAWQGLGLSSEETDLLCEIAAAVDYGTFEGAGLDLEFLDRKGTEGSSRCLLRLSLRS